ncbi:MAG: hypothetical protein LZ174_06415, partial [Thaumarchaeota archaeon]|nr:hypothetical protein [Candidatus Geocrenenecus arthurdayi]
YICSETMHLNHSLINSYSIPKPPIYREYLRESMEPLPNTLPQEAMVTQYLSERSLKLKPAA